MLLAAFDEAGEEATWSDLQRIADSLETRTARVLDLDRPEQVIAAAEALDRTEEGFVLRFASGLRVKVKGSAYLRIHRLLTRVTPLGVWEAMQAGPDGVESVRREIPEEFWGDLDRIHSLLLGRLEEVIGAVDAAVADRAGLDDKELGLALSTIPEPERRHVFAARKAGQGWADVPRTRASLLKDVRPAGDRLEGYVPSEAWRRLDDL